MDEVVAAELQRVAVIVAPAFVFGRLRRSGLVRQQCLNAGRDSLVVVLVLGQQPQGHGPLPQQFACCGQLDRLTRHRIDGYAVDGDARHVRAVFLLLRRPGVRTIW